MTSRDARSQTLPDRLAGAWMAWVVRRPLTILAALALLLAVAVTGALRLGIDADSSRMLSPDLPSQAAAAEVNRRFQDIKTSLVIVVAADRSDAADIAVARIVEALRQRTQWIAKIYTPAADPFMASHGFLYLGTDAVDSVMTRLSKSANLLARLRSEQTLDGFFTALDDASGLAAEANLGPDALDRIYEETAAVVEGQLAGQPVGFSWSALMNDDSVGKRSTRLITVTPVLDLKRLSPAKPALQEIRAVIDALPPEVAGPVTIGITGEPALRAEEMQSVVSTIWISLAISMVLVAVILWIGLRSLRRTAVALGSLVVSLVLTTGFAGFAAGDLNLVSVAFIVLMVGLGIDFAIHVLSHMAEMRDHGTPALDTPEVTGQRAGLALVLSAGTTALAFLAFTVTDFTGMAQLGLIGAVGVLISFAVAITLIPAVVALAPSVAGTDRTGHDQARRMPLAVPAALPVILACAIGLAAIVPASFARFDADPMALRDPTAPSVRAFSDLASDPATTPYRASVLARDADEAATIAEAFANRETVGATITAADLVPSDQDDKLMLLDIAAPSIEHALTGEPADLSRGGPAPADRFAALRARLAEEPETRGSAALAEALAAYAAQRTPEADMALEREIFRSFPLMIDRLDAMLMADVVEGDTLPADLRARYVAPDGTHRVEIVPDADLRDPAALQQFVIQVEAIDPRAAGGPIQMYHAGQTIAQAMLTATLLAAFATGLLAWLATRSLADVGAILAPLVLAGIVTAAASVMLDMPFNYANVIVLPLLIGIGVDSGIHVALRERRAPGAVFQTSTPRAVLFSALTTVAAFGTLAISDHRGTASMGALLAVSILAAVGAILSLTPAIIRWTRNRA